MIEEHPAQQFLQKAYHVKVARNSKGYVETAELTESRITAVLGAAPWKSSLFQVHTWEVSVNLDNPVEAVSMLGDIETRLRERYGTSES